MTDRRLTVEWEPGLAGPAHPVPVYVCPPPCSTRHRSAQAAHRCRHAGAATLEPVATAGTSRGNRYGAQGGRWVDPNTDRTEAEWLRWKAERDAAVEAAAELADGPAEPEQLGLEL